MYSKWTSIDCAIGLQRRSTVLIVILKCLQQKQLPSQTTFERMWSSWCGSLVTSECRKVFPGYLPSWPILSKVLYILHRHKKNHLLYFIRRHIGTRYTKLLSNLEKAVYQKHLSEFRMVSLSNTAIEVLMGVDISIQTEMTTLVVNIIVWDHGSVLILGWRH